MDFAEDAISGMIKKSRAKMVCSDGGGVCLCLNLAQRQRS